MDEQSRDWLIRTVTSVKIRVGTELKVLEVGQLHLRLSKATVFIPGPPSSSSDVLRDLRRNPTLGTNTWRVYYEEGENPKRNILILRLPEKEARTVTAFDSRPYLGMGRVTFKVNQPQPKGGEKMDMIEPSR